MQRQFRGSTSLTGDQPRAENIQTLARFIALSHPSLKRQVAIARFPCTMVISIEAVENQVLHEKEIKSCTLLAVLASPGTTDFNLYLIPSYPGVSMTL